MKLILLLMTLLGLVFFIHNNHAKTTDIINSPNEIAAPHSHYSSLVVLNAQRGQIIKYNDNHYKLVLIQINDLAVISKNSKPEESQLLSLEDYIKNWKNESKQYEADVTGIQSDKRIGQTQFYATFKLSNPYYNINAHKLVLDAKLINPRLNVDKEAYFDNVTIYINDAE